MFVKAQKDICAIDLAYHVARLGRVSTATRSPTREFIGTLESLLMFYS